MTGQLADDPRPTPRAPSAYRRPAAPRKRSGRRGVAVLWLIIVVPVLLILSALVIDEANVWLARVELENGLEASALAAVKEWAEGAAGSTLPARKVGVAYACQNRMRGLPIVIGTNYDPNDGVNENDECCITPGDPPKGNLIFGAIDDSDPNFPVTFNAGLEPGCGGEGVVLFDVTGESLQTAANNEWGVAFIRTANTPNDLRIRTIIIDLRAGGGDGFFISAPKLSSNSIGQWKVRDGSGGNSQADIFGFTDLDIPNGASGQIQFFLDSAFQLRIEFTNDGNNDDGFEPCDRFRFAIDADDVSKGKFGNDGDGIGEDAVGITVVFEQGPVNGPVTTFVRTGTYVNRFNRFCRDNASLYTMCSDNLTDPPLLGGDLIVAPNGAPPPPSGFPTGIPNLPCPASSGAKGNTGQSWTLLSAGGGRPFAVRAQARMCVPSLFCNLFGTCIGSRCVTVKTTAKYDCESGRPELIKLDKYICPGP